MTKLEVVLEPDGSVKSRMSKSDPDGVSLPFGDRFRLTVSDEWTVHAKRNEYAQMVANLGYEVFGDAVVTKADGDMGLDEADTLASVMSEVVSRKLFGTVYTVRQPGLVFVEELRPGTGFAYFMSKKLSPRHFIGWDRKFAMMYAMPPSRNLDVQVVPYMLSKLTLNPGLAKPDGPSVDEVNGSCGAWLRVMGSDSKVHAWCTPEEFRKAVGDAGGVSWEPRALPFENQ